MVLAKLWAEGENAKKRWVEELSRSEAKSMVERDQGFHFGHIKLEKFIRYPSK